MLPAWYGRPPGPTCPSLVNSPAIARSLRVLPVLGDLRASRRASAITTSGTGGRPSHRPVAARPVAARPVAARFASRASALQAGIRGERLTQQLLMFSRRQVMHPETLNLNRLLLDF